MNCPLQPKLRSTFLDCLHCMVGAISEQAEAIEDTVEGLERLGPPDPRDVEQLDLTALRTTAAMLVWYANRLDAWKAGRS